MIERNSSSLYQTLILKRDELSFGKTYLSPFVVRGTWTNSLNETPNLKWLKRSDDEFYAKSI